MDPVGCHQQARVICKERVDLEPVVDAVRARVVRDAAGDDEDGLRPLG
jgi:hypothetical protein